MSHMAGRHQNISGLGNDIGIAKSVITNGKFDVLVGSTVYSVRAVRGLTVLEGDPVLIARQGSGRWAIARLFLTAPEVTETNDQVPVPNPTYTAGHLICEPVETRTYRDGEWRTSHNEVIQGILVGSAFGNNTGCAFYGTKPRSLAGATVTQATIRVRRFAGGSTDIQTSTLRLVTESVKPAGAPTLNETVTGPSLAVKGIDDAFVIPNAWAQAIVDGTRGGLAVFNASGNPYMVFAGNVLWSPAWTMTIYWRRD